jgi:glycosyltransferase involved in cell wall biosynthesis
LKEKTDTPEKQEILLLLTQDLKSPSGLGRYFPIAKYLVKAGFSVTIAALHPNYKSLSQNQFIQDGVKVHYVSQMHVLKDENQTIYFGPGRLIWLTIKATWKLFKAGINHPYDVILIGKPHPMNGVAGFLAGRMRKSKIIVDCDDYEAASNHYTSKWQRGIVQLFENGIPKITDLVTTNTHFTAQRLTALGVKPDKIHYLPNGIDPDRFDKEQVDAQQKIRKQFDLADYKIIIYIGSLNLSNHAVDLLIRSFKIVHTENKNSKLMIVGGGKDFDELKSLAEELGIHQDVIFTGRISPDKISAYYRIADISVDPVYNTDADRGRCPLKLFESWATGTAIVTSDVGDRSILGKDGTDLVLAKPGDPEDLAKEILVLLKNSSTLSLIGKNGKEKSNDFYWEVLINESKEIFLPE